MDQILSPAEIERQYFRGLITLDETKTEFDRWYADEDRKYAEQVARTHTHSPIDLLIDGCPACAATGVSA